MCFHFVLFLSVLREKKGELIKKNQQHIHTFIDINTICSTDIYIQILQIHFISCVLVLVYLSVDVCVFTLNYL